MKFCLRFGTNLVDQAEYDELKTISPEKTGPDVRNQSMSEDLYGDIWLVNDLQRLFTLYYHTRDPDISKLLSAIYQLRQLVQADAKSHWKIFILYPHEWTWWGVKYSTRQRYTDCLVELQVEECIILTALRSGLYEFWPTYALDNNLRSITLQAVTEALRPAGSIMSMLPISYGPHRNRLLQTLATCLANGTSANALMRVDTRFVNVSVWQSLVWDTIATFGQIGSASQAPMWLLFILYGADRDFTVTFEQSCNFSCGDRRGKLFLLTGKWGVDKSQVHSPVYLNGGGDGDDGEGECDGQDSDLCKILDLAKRHGWSVPLKELACFFFPRYAGSFRRIYDLYESNLDITLERLSELRREFGLDPEHWQTQEGSDIQSRLQYQWEGGSQLLRDPGYESDDSSSSTLS